MNSRRFSSRSLFFRASVCFVLTTGCRSLTGQDFATKIDERDTNNDGRPDKRLISMWRCKDLLVQRFEIFDRNTGGTNYWGEQIFFEGKALLALIYTARGVERTFLPKSGAGIGEQDKDRDGKPDLVLIMDRNGDIHDAVERNALGFLEPVGKARLKQAKATLSAAEKAMRDLLNQNGSEPRKEKK